MPRPRPTALAWPYRLAPLLLALTAGACASLIGLDDYERVDGPAPTSGAAGSGGTGGSGGAGEVCTPGTVESCYSGPVGTEGQGICRGGMRTCSDAGVWGTCEGEVLPTAEVCATPVDDDCDGPANEEGADCDCVPGTTMPCYSGPASTQGVGLCSDGQQVCNVSGNGYGACTGEVLPAAEVCGTDIDEDCDGEGWFPDTDCVCEPNSTEACYTGPMGTLGIGICTAGTWTCNADGLGWGTCMGETLPAASENCGTAADEDCDGEGWYANGDTDCTCTPNTTTQACYTGPMGTEGVGACHGGTATCNADGLGYGSCQGQMLPGVEVCNNAVLDEDCSGAACPGEVEWAIAAGGSGDQTVHDVAVDSVGNVYVVGEFNGSISFGNQAGQTVTSEGVDGFLLKLDADGNFVWVKRFGPTETQVVRGVAVDGGGNVYVTGYFDSSITIGQFTRTSGGVGDEDLFVAKLDSNGNALWANDYGSTGADQRALGIDVTAQGEVAITGTFDGSITMGGATGTSAGGQDLFVAMMDTNGNPAWIQHYGNNQLQRGNRIAFGSDVFVTGDVEGTFQVGGIGISAGNNSDVFATRIGTGTAVPAWASRWGSPSDAYADVGSDIAIDTAENVLLTGDFTGTFSFGGGSSTSATPAGFVAKLSPTGGHLFSTFFTATGDFHGSALDADSASNVTVTGDFKGAIDFGGGLFTSSGSGLSIDIFIVKLSPSLAHIWSRHYPATGSQYCTAVAIAPTDHVIAAGHIEGTVNFGLFTVHGNDANNDSPAIFVAKLAP